MRGAHLGADAGSVDAHLVLPATLGPATRPMVVLHGTERNAAEYADRWAAWAREHDRLLVCPEFDRARWPGSRCYNLGNVLAARSPASRGERAVPLSRRRWAFTALVDLMDGVADMCGIADPTFDVFGHSAGAQFAHRLPLFRPDAPLGAVLVANSGWFTLPDPARDFPYGTRHPGLGIDARRLEVWTRTPMVLLRGTGDVERDPHVRTTPAADAQGPHRYARAGCMYRTGHDADPGCRWELVDVPGVAHDFVGMSAAAQDRLVTSPHR